MVEPLVGAARPRREDPALVTGTATYTDDLDPTDVLHAAFLRCPYGHARIEHVDVGPALEQAGVVAAYGAADLAEAGGPSGIPMPNQFPGPETVERPVLAADRARFCGDPVAVVIAEERYVAHDALGAIAVEYDRLPAVVDAREAATGDGPKIGAEGVSDTAEWRTGDEAAVDRAFERATHRVSVAFEQPRLIPASMEPRAVLAEPGGEAAADGPSGGPPGDAPALTVTTSTQTPHRHRNRLAETLGMTPTAIRVVTPAVGGGFGTKGWPPYPEYPLCAWAALQLDRPVKWAGTRSEGQQTDHQGRGVDIRGELALSAEGAIQALRIRGYVDIGGYPLRGPAAGIRPQLMTGPYVVPALDCQLVGVLTNAAPLGPYRGAGRPEAIFLLERLVRRAASELEVDPAALRRRNFIPPDAFPYETLTGYTYDSGDYATTLDRALDAVDYDAVRREQAAARSSGRYVGIGLASFVENSGSARSEWGRVTIDETGHVTAYCGTADQGQGHATAFAQLIADELGVSDDDVALVEGDTAALEDGTGTFASRSVPVGASALVECARAVVEAATPTAAEALEADPADVRFEAGTFSVAGAPDRAVALETVARLAAEAGDPLAAARDFAPPDPVYAFGTHAAVVEVDPAIGEVDIRRYVAVDDCGVQINPTLVEGQIHGSVAQGLGQARCEAAVYDDTGSLLTSSFQDYALMRAPTMPELEVHSTVTPSPVTPHGAKGVGEAGTIAAPPAIVNAVVDALEPLGIDDVPLPVTPEAVWRTIAAAERAGE